MEWCSYWSSMENPGNVVIKQQYQMHSNSKGWKYCLATRSTMWPPSDLSVSTTIRRFSKEYSLISKGFTNISLTKKKKKRKLQLSYTFNVTVWVSTLLQLLTSVTQGFLKMRWFDIFYSCLHKSKLQKEKRGRPVETDSVRRESRTAATLGADRQASCSLQWKKRRVATAWPVFCLSLKPKHM